jgi:hypothetical protein
VAGTVEAMTVSDLSKLAAETVPVPEDDAAPEYACETCGKELHYGGRGRHPRFCEEHKPRGASNISTRKSSAKGDVAAALSALDMMYDLLGMGFLVVGAHDAADLFKESREQLKEKNESYLSNDAALAKSLAKLGRTGGRYAFATAQIATVGPVLILATGEVTQRRRAAAAERDAGDVAREEGPTFVPGGVFVAD